MCYTAIPGRDTTIRAVFFETVPRRLAEPTPKPVRHMASARAAASLMESMSHEFAAGRGDSRRDRQTSYEKGKRLAKRSHKPNWRYYEKY